jgi:hypothetical protein
MNLLLTTHRSSISHGFILIFIFLSLFAFLSCDRPDLYSLAQQKQSPADNSDVIGQNGQEIGGIDLDGDGVQDGSAIDINGDGIPDGVDTDGDGTIDIEMTDAMVFIAYSDDNFLLSFSFNSANNPGLDADVTASISGTSVSATFKKNILASAVPTFSVSSGATVSVGGFTQTSGFSSQNFSSPVRYDVTSESGLVQTYTVEAVPQTITGDLTVAVTITNVESIAGAITIDWNATAPTWYTVEMYQNDLGAGSRSKLMSVDGTDGSVTLDGSDGLVADSYYHFELVIEDDWGNESTVPVSVGAVASTAARNYKLIYSANDLDTIVRGDLSGHYIQMADIDLSSYSGGQGWAPISTFTGTYIGNGYEISSLTINRDQLNQGLLG